MLKNRAASLNSVFNERYLQKNGRLNGRSVLNPLKTFQANKSFVEQKNKYLLNQAHNKY